MCLGVCRAPRSSCLQHIFVCSFRSAKEYTHSSAIGLKAQRSEKDRCKAVKFTGVAELVEVEARGAHDLVASGLCKSFCEASREDQ